MFTAKSDDGLLLATKLLAPPLRLGLIARPRLTERLDGGLRPGHRLTLVSAHAGSGKTTLVSAWAASCLERGLLAPRHLAWLSLDEEDNDPARFLAYLT